MAFQKEVVRTPTSVGRIEIILRDFPNEAPSQAVLYQATVIFSDGSEVQRTGDLAPQLTNAQITSLQNFMAAMRTKAVAEFI